MEKNNKPSPVSIRFFSSSKPKTENLVRDQLKETLTHNSNKLKKELIKKIKKSVCVDSSYYLG